MSNKIGRNDPCPCGSGRKYKQCHGRDPGPSAIASDSHEDAARRALEWLSNRHGKALEREITDMLFDDLWPEDGPHPEDVDPQAMGQMLANLNEWMLGQGDIEIRKRWHSVNELLLGEGGPALNPAQRDFIRQLETQPLRLYTVTAVDPGQGLTLVDALDDDRDPVVVQDRALSQSAQPGLLLGCRILQFGDRFELSGAVYPFSTLGQSAAVEVVTRHMEQDIHPEDRAYERGWAIMAEWLRQMVMPPDIPQMVDASTGDPLLFVTDHYRVLDPAGLKEVLDACPELEPDADGGWAKTVTGTDGVVRAALNIHRGKVAARLEVFYRTQRLADEGRVWFETLAGVHVRHLTRELTDPVGALRSGLDKGGTDDAGSPASGASTGIAPEAHTQMIEQVVRRIYAKWPDEQLPALGNRTPREAIRTRAGLERVKGLLRMYAADEDERARSERRAPVSYGFLWEALGIGPE